MLTATGSPEAAVWKTEGRMIVCDSVYDLRVSAWRSAATDS